MLPTFLVHEKLQLHLRDQQWRDSQDLRSGAGRLRGSVQWGFGPLRRPDLRRCRRVGWLNTAKLVPTADDLHRLVATEILHSIPLAVMAGLGYPFVGVVGWFDSAVLLGSQLTGNILCLGNAYCHDLGVAGSGHHGTYLVHSGMWISCSAVRTARVLKNRGFLKNADQGIVYEQKIATSGLPD